MEIRIGDVARAAMSAAGIHRMEVEAIIATPDTVDTGDMFVRHDGRIGGRRRRFWSFATPTRLWSATSWKVEQMGPISSHYDAAVDVLRISLCVGIDETEAPRTHHSRAVDFHRYLEYDKDGRLLAAVFLGPSAQGIDLHGMPEADRIAAGLEQLRSPLGLVPVP